MAKVVALAGRRTGGRKKVKKRGRRPGSKNRPRELSPDSPYLTVADYCRQRGISETTFYRTHRKELEVVQFDHSLLILKSSAAARDQRFIQRPTVDHQASA